MHCTTSALIHERTVDMDIILHLFNYITGAAVVIASTGGDFWSVFYNGFNWYWNFMCQWGC